MFRILCLVCATALIGACVPADNVVCADTHHAGHDKLGKKINKDGKHEIHQTDHHTVHAHVKGKKVTGVSATHKKTGKHPKVTKYKSAKKLHALLDNPRGDIHYVMAEPQVAAATIWIGFGFFEGGQLFIFWFPLELVDGGADGATDYSGDA